MRIVIDGGLRIGCPVLAGFHQFVEERLLQRISLGSQFRVPNDTTNQITNNLARRERFSFQYAFLSSSFLNAIFPSSCQVKWMFYFYIFLTGRFSGDFCGSRYQSADLTSRKNPAGRSIGYTLDLPLQSRNETMVVGRVVGGCV